MFNKTKGKKAAAVGALLGVVAAGFKTRQHMQEAHSVQVIPLKLSKGDWKKVVFGVKDGVGGKNLPTLAAGVAYFSTLAFFPLLAAAVAISALLISPGQLDSLVHATEVYLPEDIARLVTSQLQGLVSRRSDNFFIAAIAITVALYGASGASKNLVIASNAVYGVRESRGWLAQQIWGIAWTLAALVFVGVIVALLAVNQAFLDYLGLPDWIVSTVLGGRWLVALLFSMSGLAVFYRYGPNRPRVHWHWVIPGAVIATVVWLIATALFFMYVQNFANYTQSYSLFAGIIVLMIWMNISALIALVGAEINYQMEVVGRKK